MLDAALDHTYDHRPYYQRERAAALFETGDYAQAVEWYERATTAAPDPATLGRLGDSLFHAGRYREALEVLDRYAEAPLDSEPQWMLTRRAADQVVRRHGDHQDRQPERANALAQDALSMGNDPVALQRAAEALSLDALCGAAWWAIGRVEVNHGAGVVEGASALATAISQGGDTEAWADVILAAIHSKDEGLVRLLARTGYVQHGPVLLEGIRQKMMSGPSEFRTLVLGFLREYLGDLSAGQRLTIRFAGADGIIEHQIERPRDL